MSLFFRGIDYFFYVVKFFGCKGYLRVCIYCVILVCLRELVLFFWLRKWCVWVGLRMGMVVRVVNSRSIMLGRVESWGYMSFGGIRSDYEGDFCVFFIC